MCYEYNPVSEALASAIASGLKKNNELKEICLFVRKACLDRIVSGLCRHGDKEGSSSSPSKLESLTLRTEEPENNPELGARVLEAIQCTPSLKTLAIKALVKDERDCNPYAQPWVDFFLKNLHHPECSGLETLRLANLYLGDSQDDINEDDVTGGDVENSWIVPENQANKTLKKVILDYVSFARFRDVSLLYNLKGLKELNITTCCNGGEDDSDDDDDDNNNNNNSSEVGQDDINRESNVTDYWADLIRNSPELCKIYLDVDDDDRIHASFIKGACGHGTLQSLTLYSRDSVVMDGARLRSLLGQLLREPSCLKHLYIHCDMKPHENLAAGLADGLRDNNSLDKLDFQMQHLSSTNFRTILESLLENQTLKELSCPSFKGHYTDFSDDDYREKHNGRDIGSTISRLFQVNRSLCHITLPPLNLSGQMRVFVQGLGQTTTLKSLDLGHCLTTPREFTLLAQTLLENATNLSVENIVSPANWLIYSNNPYNSAWRPSSSSRPFSELNVLLRGIVRMRNLKTLDLRHLFECNKFNRLYNQEYMDCLKLLLHAAKEN